MGMGILISLVVSIIMLETADNMFPNMILQVIIVFLFPSAVLYIGIVTVMYIIIFVVGGQR